MFVCVCECVCVSVCVCVWMGGTRRMRDTSATEDRGTHACSTHRELKPRSDTARVRDASAGNSRPRHAFGRHL